MSVQESDLLLKWWDLGACKGLDSSIFYPDDEQAAEMAKSICDSCGVRDTCLEHALTVREKAGVWGGASERDRRRILRQRRRAR
ncbi:MAG: WhiB family transcriptional regulator [Actinomycetota bacterium]